eukprot:CAMPEP_0118689920 /NCGR_PEP_ID=MMETSP0800-20121206/9772_1 /TAXON_ID=210618 ORGANISM="Striatella unipunctata, Strain CCMP2910" /NCGR_SAMPLE_ID=MMETSP0800 /ASSEMBLY_ACC=CAM_ASM_000638 /LENGTH=960 /DNA_ID=CAMNT_0006587401 /DNA_START=100 /DNA_END=2982 /DNA_ORIENTATION=+
MEPPRQDYLLRNFELYRLESAYQIRLDLVDVIRRVRPVVRYTVASEAGDEGFETGEVVKTAFSGWARMALELVSNVDIVKVAPPRLGENHPAQVLADLCIDLEKCGEGIRKEWNYLGEYDNLFLLAIDAQRITNGNDSMPGNEQLRLPDEEDPSFPNRYGVVAVRGCMILQVRDETGNILSDLGVPKDAKEIGTKRFFRVALDPSQYAMDAGEPNGLKLYEALNLVVRRHGRENNFRAVLETIRGLMEGSGSIDRTIPSWLQPVLLGYGNSSSASYKSKTIRSYASRTAGVSPIDAFLDYGDTFLDDEHLIASFPGYKVMIDDSFEPESRPFRVKYKVKVIDSPNNETQGNVEARSYPFPKYSAGNSVRFTPVQVEAVRSGLIPGLTLVVGPPGTGKSDCAVQIIANLFHSYPTQRTVIITHSNTALNDLFQKVMERGDINERFMIRLGSGERDLKTESTHDFTKMGRVAHTMERRALLLECVQKLSESLGVSGSGERGADGSPSYTCETAEYFFERHVKMQIAKFENAMVSADTGLDVFEAFPFKKYCLGSKNPRPLTVQEARSLLSEVADVFKELADYRPLELLRSLRQRTDYLLTKQARIVAMTCTHAAIARSQLIDLGFQYDNLVMEEAGQMLEVETFIPLLLQKGEADNTAASQSRLKRISLIGDHNQLPPVIKNRSFSTYSNLDQSLFRRLVRIGVPYIELNKQGRARAEIAKLYSWRYSDLGDLPHVLESSKFQNSNAGFAYTHQMINVENFKDQGETTPTAYFYQNLGEAEYAVALFQYMVLIGYPSDKISILTTYNGQKELIHDILIQRCGPGTPLGNVYPGAVSTVDHYQGQQNDFVILSLVRTSSVGHIRDIRRLVVGVSRARLGLYVVCRSNIFSACHELRSTMAQFEDKPQKLQIVIGEHYPPQRRQNDPLPDERMFEVKDVEHLGSIVHELQEQMIRTEQETTPAR